MRPLAASVNSTFVEPCDVTQDDQIKAVMEKARAAFGEIDILVHAIAFANRDDLSSRPYYETSRAGFHLALDISVYSFTALAREALPLMRPGGAMVTLTYHGSVKAVSHYNIMGVAKAALESSVRYLAVDLGSHEKHIRVNAISAGPIRTLSAAGVAGFKPCTPPSRTWPPAAPRDHRRRRQRRPVPVLRLGRRGHRRNPLCRFRLQCHRSAHQRRGLLSQDRSAQVSVPVTTIEEIKRRVAGQSEAITGFMRELCAIPSIMGQIGAVGQRVIDEMQRLGLTRRASTAWATSSAALAAARACCCTTRTSTRWMWATAPIGAGIPFEGKVENGVLFARGAGDEKQSTPGMIYGLALARDLGLLEGYTVYYFGNMEEDCDGQCCQVLVEVEKIKPDFVVVGEPTEMNIYRGHKGRVELKVVAKGRSAHAASNELGDNAIYKLLPVISGVRELNHQLHIDPFLGQGRITVSIIQSRSPSLNAVPNECTLYIDRRLTFGETKEEALAQVQALIPHDDQPLVSVEIMHYDTPSYTGFVYPVEKYFPAWALAEDHPLVRAGLRASEALWGGTAQSGKLNFSTNAIYWMGKANIPTIIFAAGIETTAHSLMDQVPLDDLVRATEWYAFTASGHTPPVWIAGGPFGAAQCRVQVKNRAAGHWPPQLRQAVAAGWRNRCCPHARIQDRSRMVTLSAR